LFPPQDAPNGRKLVEEVPVDHRHCKSEAPSDQIQICQTKHTLVDDQDFGSEPSGTRFLVLLDFHSEIFSALNAQTNASERVDGYAANVARRYAWREHV
jgi:hypothetical protein